MIRDELMEMSPKDLYDSLRQNGLNKKWATPVTELIVELRDSQDPGSGGAARLPQPGPFQPRFQAAGDDGMASIKIPLPAPPDPTTLDPKDRPVKRKVTGKVGDAVLFEQVIEDLAQAELSVTVTQGSAEVTVDIGQSFCDADDNWCEPTMASLPIPAAPVVIPEKDTTPPAPPANFTPVFVPDAVV